MRKILWCYECQKELWNSGQAVKKACSIEFSCTYEEGKQIWERIEEKCANELTIYVDWSANPSSLDDTVVAPYTSLLLFYFAVPEYSSLCHKTSNGELCGIKSIRPLVDWLKQEIPEGKVQFSYDFLYDYKEDGTRIKVPMELVTKCGECGKNMMKEYKNWMDQHAVPDPIVKNMFNGSLEAVQEYFSCPILL